MSEALGVGWAAGAPATAHAFVEALLDAVVVDGPDGHHLARARRLRVGEGVTAADGLGHWRLYVVAGVGAGSLRLEAGGPVTREPALRPGLAVAFAVTKGARPEATIAGLTELGVDRILPVTAIRSVVRPDPDRAAAALARWRLVAREAAGQSRRARFPEIGRLVALGSLTGHPGVVLGQRAGGPGGQAAPPLPAAADLTGPPGGELLVVVGPEGGLEADEVGALRPWATVTVGPHVLRAETAAIAVAAVAALARSVAPSATAENPAPQRDEMPRIVDVRPSPR